MKIKLKEEQVKRLIDNIINENDVNDLYNNFQKLNLIGGSSSPQLNNPEFSPEIPNGSEMMHPLGHKTNISSGFGKRNLKIGSKNHKGVDLRTPSGSKIYAPLDGKVIDARDTTPNGCGGFIELDHGNLKTKFCHVRQWVVNRGDDVKKGQVIGYSGGGASDPYKGTSSGSHLHYEILNSSGIAMNPINIEPNLV